MTAADCFERCPRSERQRGLDRDSIECDRQIAAGKAHFVDVAGQQRPGAAEGLLDILPVGFWRRGDEQKKGRNDHQCLAHLKTPCNYDTRSAASSLAWCQVTSMKTSATNGDVSRSAASRSSIARPSSSTLSRGDGRTFADTITSSGPM